MIAILAAAVAQVCVVTYANDRPSMAEIRTHEIAHINGWEHPEQKWKYPPKNYVAPKPPKEFIHKPTTCELKELPLETHAVQVLCRAITGRASWGCWWIE